MNYIKPSHYHSDRPYYQVDYQYYYPKVLELIEPNSSILDIGCGRGGLIKILKDDFNCDVTGLDISLEAKYQCEKKGLNFILEDIDNTQFNGITELYDYILIIGTLEHLSDPRHVLTLLNKFVKKYIIIGVPNFSNIIWRYYYLIGKNAKIYTYPNEETPFLGIQSDGHIQFFNKHSLSHLLKISGYELVKWNNARFSSYDPKNNKGITHKSILGHIRKLIWSNLPCNEYFSTLLIVKAGKNENFISTK